MIKPNSLKASPSRPLPGRSLHQAPLSLSSGDVPAAPIPRRPFCCGLHGAVSRHLLSFGTAGLPPPLSILSRGQVETLPLRPIKSPLQVLKGWRKRNERSPNASSLSHAPLVSSSHAILEPKLSSPLNSSPFSTPRTNAGAVALSQSCSSERCRRPAPDSNKLLLEIQVVYTAGKVVPRGGLRGWNIGVEPTIPDMMMYEVEDGCSKDFALFSVAEILERVSKFPNMIEERDKDQYDKLLGIVNPKRKNLDEEVLLVANLKALSSAVYKISNIFHISLLRNIFSMWIWSYGLDARNALLELIVNLAVVPDKFLEECLEMLVRNFQPSREVLDYITLSGGQAGKKRIYGQLYEALHSITYLVPLAPLKLKDILERRMPKLLAHKEGMVSFIECMLGLESDEIGEYLGSTLLSMVVELLVDLDVDISWEDILKEDHNKGIFDVEIEDLEENAECSEDGQIVGGKGNNNISRVKMDKLDSLMVIFCQHIESSACNGRLLKVFDILLESFRKTVLNAYKSKFSQFVLFYACSLDPEVCGLKFAILLTDIFVSKAEDPVSRMSAVAYLASYMSRARFISSSVVASIVRRLVEWCYDFCNMQNGYERTNHPGAYRLFYSGCQAVMYILCFRMRLMMDIPQLKSLLFHLPLEAILSHPLDPLRVCLPTIVNEFLRQANAAHLLKKPLMTHFQNDLLESEFSKAFGGVERLDMFFPFDPYLLKKSDRFMRPNFEFWSMVRKTYSNFNSDDEFEDLDPDSGDEGSYDGHDDAELSDDNDEDLGYSMNKMSITPGRAFEISTADGSIPVPCRMPARIRPSVSPV